MVPLTPMILIHLERLKVRIRKITKHGAGVVLLIQQEVRGEQHGDAKRQLQLLNDPRARIAEREQLPSNLTAIQWIHRKKVHQSPNDVDEKQLNHDQA